MNVNNARYRTKSDKTRYTLIVRPCSRGTGHKREMRGLDIRYDLHRHLGVVKYPGMHATLIAWGLACRVARMQRTCIHRNPGMLPPAIRETNKSTDHHLSSNLDIINGAWVRSGTRRPACRSSSCQVWYHESTHQIWKEPRCPVHTPNMEAQCTRQVWKELRCPVRRATEVEAPPPRATGARCINVTKIQLPPPSRRPQ